MKKKPKTYNSKIANLLENILYITSVPEDVTQLFYTFSNLQHLIIQHYYSYSTINNTLSPSCLFYHHLILY